MVESIFAFLHTKLDKRPFFLMSQHHSREESICVASFAASIICLQVVITIHMVRVFVWQQMHERLAVNMGGTLPPVTKSNHTWSLETPSRRVEMPGVNSCVSDCALAIKSHKTGMNRARLFRCSNLVWLRRVLICAFKNYLEEDTLMNASVSNYTWSIKIDVVG